MSRPVGLNPHQRRRGLMPAKTIREKSIREDAPAIVRSGRAVSDRSSALDRERPSAVSAEVWIISPTPVA